jgi:nitroreductase
MAMNPFDPHLESIHLPTPLLPDSSTLGQALHARHSSRSFAPEALPLSVVSGLLWAAFGVNRPSVGGRTAPSAHNWQEVDVHVVLPEASYRYDAHSHRLLRVRAGDLRAATGTQDFVAGAPLNLVYVADFARMVDATADERSFLAGADAGCIAQNVYLFCACAGLSTVVRGLIDRGRLAAALGLTTTQRIVLAQTVGLPLAAV